MIKKIKINKDTNKIVYVTKKFKSTLLTGKNESYVLNHPSLIYCDSPIKKLSLNKINISLNKINKLTNCPDGKFHKWVLKKDLVCSLCNQKYKDLISNKNVISNKEYTDNTIKKIIYMNLNKLAIKFCLEDKENLYGLDKKTC